MKLVVVSDTHLLENEHETINALFEAGAACFHLRKPGSNAELLAHLIRQFHPAFWNRIVLHDHYHLVFQFGLGGIHFPEAARAKISNVAWLKMVQKARKHHLTLSASIHDKEVLQQINPQYDYVFFSPVFESISKPGHRPVADMNIRGVEIKPFVIGLGGVNSNNILQLKQMGYDGAAVLGAIWCNPRKIVENFIKIQHVCRNNAPTF